jgi:murein L,D-transpeptidase YcbB/YkuD
MYSRRKPFELAEILLNNPMKWNPESIKAVFESNKPHTVTLPEHIPVLILYWTVAVDQDGTVHFKKNPYNRDKGILEALENEFEIRKRPIGRIRPKL